MSSLLTNASAMVALQTLASTSADLATTQGRISTGLQVESAQDNAAYWSIATSMRSDVGALSSVEDSLGLGSAILDVASTAMESAIDVMDEIKKKLVTAAGEGVDRKVIQSDITELQNQLKTIAGSASFNSENWLKADTSAADYNATKTIVSGFTRDSAGVISIDSISVSTATMLLVDDAATKTGILDKDVTVGGTTSTVVTIDIKALTDSTADKLKLTETTKILETQLALMQTAAGQLGSAKTRVELQSTFTTELSDAMERGIGQLVDADMDKESTRLKALQTQQQLGIQALQVANANGQNILKLFQG